jgi:NAD(P)H-flavin reductase
MKNPYKTQSVKILDVKEEGSGSKLFTLKSPKGFKFKSGQFIQISLPGFGEAPFSICSSPNEKKSFELCVKKIGTLTNQFHKMKKGENIGIRGPYGTSFPVKLLESRDLILVGGGIGIEPLRSVILEILGNRNKYQKVQLLYGACSEEDLLFASEYDKWRSGLDFFLTLDKPKGDPGKNLPSKWKCQTGVVTNLFEKVRIYRNAVAFLCGPSVMYKFVIKKLKELNFKDEDIYLSLERRMHCGVGACNHCAVGSFSVCKDGPVFSWAQLRDIRGAI